jgi:predicted N-acetyltransferase YhbS
LIQVRNATEADTAAAREFGAAAFAPWRAVYVPSPAAIAGAREESAKFSRLVAEVGGTVVGTVCWRRIEDRFHIRALAVTASHRRAGVARAIIEHCVALARAQGARAVSAYTVTATGNVAVFERLGFAVVRQGIDPTSTTPAGEPVTEAYLERLVE